MTHSPWPADKVKRWPVAKLVPYARNARTHTEAQVAQIAASIREWGFTNPVLVDESGTIIAGHGRVLAAQMLGLKDVPTMVAIGWTDSQRRAYTLADNKLALNAGWDDEMLRLEVSDLSGAGVDVSMLGFSQDDLTDLLADEVADAPAGGGELGYVIQYNIIFDDELQQNAWFGFLRQLKERYPDGETIGARLTRFLQDTT